MKPNLSLFGIVMYCCFVHIASKGNIDDQIDEIISSSFEPWLKTRNISLSARGIQLLMNISTECTNSRRCKSRCDVLQRIQIVSNTVQFSDEGSCNSKRKKYVNKFSVLVKKHFLRIANVCPQTRKIDFVVNIKDEPYQLREKAFSNYAKIGVLEAPVFSFQTTKEHLDVPIEYSREAYDSAFDKFVDNLERNKSSSVHIPWDSKVNIAFWRGSQTGGWYSTKNWREHTRSKLSLLSKKYPLLLDCGFSSWTQIGLKTRLVVEKELGPLKPYLSMFDQGRFKYLISLDGNGWASRLPFLFALGSLVVKQESNFTTWWYPLLKPYVHYLPVSRSLDDLLDIVNWANRHDAEAKKIANAGREFILNTVYNHSDKYMCKLLQAYSSLQANKV